MEYQFYKTTNDVEYGVPHDLAPHINETLPWEWDEELQAVVREEDGRRVFLYDEVMRVASRENIGTWPMHNRSTIKALFGDTQQWDVLLVHWYRLIFELRIFQFPEIWEYLAFFHTTMMHPYWAWRLEGGFDFHEDEEGLTPGRLVKSDVDPYPSDPPFATVNGWYTEYTGEWRKDDNAPTGISPAKYLHVAAQNVNTSLKFFMNSINGEGAYSALLDMKPDGVVKMQEAVTEVIGQYPAP